MSSLAPSVTDHRCLEASTVGLSDELLQLQLSSPLPIHQILPACPGATTGGSWLSCPRGEWAGLCENMGMIIKELILGDQ